MSEPFPVPKVIGHYKGIGGVTEVETRFPEGNLHFAHLYYARWSNDGETLTVHWCTSKYTFSKNVNVVIDKVGKESKVIDGDKIVKADSSLITIADMVSLCVAPFSRKWIYMHSCTEILVSTEVKK